MTGAVPRIWFFASFENVADATRGYTTLEAAKRAAIADYQAAINGPILPDDVYRWDVSDQSGRHMDQPGHHMLFAGAMFTGYWVQSLEIVGAEIEWTVARHGLRSIEYGAYAMTESLARDEVREELACGGQASVAYRLTGQWRHEDPEAQRHADAINAALEAGAQ